MFGVVSEKKYNALVAELEKTKADMATMQVNKDVFEAKDAEIRSLTEKLAQSIANNVKLSSRMKQIGMLASPKDP